MASFDREIAAKNISRLSLAIRVMHTRNSANHLLWMSAAEDLQTLESFLNSQCAKNNVNKIQINKNTEKFHTVLCNNKLNDPNSPYFSVDEMYHLHKQTGAYKKVSGK